MLLQETDVPPWSIINPFSLFSPNPSARPLAARSNYSRISSAIRQPQHWPPGITPSPFA